MTRQQYSERAADKPLERPTLIWQHQGRKAGEYVLWPERPVTVGRDATSTIQIDSPFVSKNHAVFQYRGGDWVLEDLNSANGTRVNGNPIRIHFGLRRGDQIEIGEEVLQFVDASEDQGPASAPSPAGKWLRLGLAGVVAAMVVVVTLLLLVRSAPNSPATESATTSRPGAAGAASPSDGRVRIVDTALIDQTLDRARRTGVGEADALFDEGLLNLQSARYRDAAQLLAAAQLRRPNDAGIKSRLSDAQRALDESISEALADAALATRELRYDEARLAWERVIALTYPGDPRYLQATDNLRKLEGERRKRG